MIKLMLCVSLSLTLGISSQCYAANASSTDKTSLKSQPASSKSATKIKMDKKWLSENKSMQSYMTMAQTYLKDLNNSSKTPSKTYAADHQGFGRNYETARAYASELLLNHFSDNSLSVEIKPLTDDELLQFGASINQHFFQLDKAYFNLDENSDSLDIVIAHPDQVLAKLEKVSYKSGELPTSKGLSRVLSQPFEIIIKPKQSNRDDFSTLTLTHMRDGT